MHAIGWEALILLILMQLPKKEAGLGQAFGGSATPHGGNESTIISLYNPMAHLGLIIVPTGFADAAMFKGAGTPYGASVVSGNPPSGPTPEELDVARFQGRRVTQVAKKLFA